MNGNKVVKTYKLIKYQGVLWCRGHFFVPSGRPLPWFMGQSLWPVIALTILHVSGCHLTLSATQVYQGADLRFPFKGRCSAKCWVPYGVRNWEGLIQLDIGQVTQVVVAALVGCPHVNSIKLIIALWLSPTIGHFHGWISSILPWKVYLRAG